MINRPLPYSDDIETIPLDEADVIQRVAKALESISSRSQAKTGQFRADVHVKTHGYTNWSHPSVERVGRAVLAGNSTKIRAYA
jgi:hypothetical protein